MLGKTSGGGAKKRRAGEVEVSAGGGFVEGVVYIS